ncbi:MAG: 3'(2'),5'-bisphosphate nucleotidase CysQ [Verrucomicrobiae bacterium]|nr:3'(2'),5'-bisphosphate nucleotidase CysQ [Verrucomicrobiae bacterium]MCP5541500.1 3'(2'),5'-bisphosphate nucleotidase CysQ [Akkermansiaceae bacterium]
MTKHTDAAPDGAGGPPEIDIAFLLETARRAGDAILEVYGTDFAVDVKEDRSPLTEADRAGNAVIVAALRERYPEIPIISEENKETPHAERKDWTTFWLVDPLDGTKEFIKRNGEFTVNIALIHGGEPVAGVVFQPAADRMYWADPATGAWRSVDGGEPERLRGGAHFSEKEAVTVVASRSHLTDEVHAFVAELEAAGKAVEFRSSGSSLKLCLVAEGEADVYPRLGPTMEWDTGAAHAVARAAGRAVLNWETREPLRYNKESLLNPWFVVE